VIVEKPKQKKKKGYGLAGALEYITGVLINKCLLNILVAGRTL